MATLAQEEKRAAKEKKMQDIRDIEDRVTNLITSSDQFMLATLYEQLYIQGMNLSKARDIRFKAGATI